MSHGRPPRRPRRISNNPIALARNNATLLTAAEISTAIAPLRAAAKALREGVASEWEWAVVVSAMDVAKAIEAQGVVRGLAEHLRSAELALQAIQQRAMVNGSWRPTAMYWLELDQLRTAVDLHEFQLQRLSYGEFRHAVARATAEIRSTGGRVVHVGQLQGVAA